MKCQARLDKYVILSDNAATIVALSRTVFKTVPKSIVGPIVLLGSIFSFFAPARATVIIKISPSLSLGVASWGVDISSLNGENELNVCCN